MFICPICRYSYIGYNAWGLSLHIVNRAHRETEHADWVNERFPDSNAPYIMHQENIDLARKVLQDIKEHPELYVEEQIEELVNLMYRKLRNIEVNLHEFIEYRSKQYYGAGDDHWWEKGIPLKIRKNCVIRREEDTGKRLHPYMYTDLIDLAEILDKNWQKLFLSDFERAKKYFEDKSDFLKTLYEVNDVRKKIMHPIRYLHPDKKTLECLEWVNEAMASFYGPDWKYRPPFKRRSRQEIEKSYQPTREELEKLLE